MGGGPVCPDASIPCGYVGNEQTPNWDNDLGTYRIRVEFEPQLDLDNSTILGHDDEAPLHPGIPYTAQIVLSDRNGWQDIQYIQLALGGDFDDDDTSMFISLTMGADGAPVAVMESGSENIAVSNLYSSVSLDEQNSSIIKILARFQMTWTFPESFDTDSSSLFIPKLLVTDLPCNEEKYNRALKPKQVWQMMLGALTMISDLTRWMVTFEQSNYVTEKITTILNLMKLLLVQVKR